MSAGIAPEYLPACRFWAILREMDTLGEDDPAYADAVVEALSLALACGFDAGVTMTEAGTVQGVLRLSGGVLRFKLPDLPLPAQGAGRR